jgi:tRNA1(Val) A37 N6-methylase TrmN6
MGLIFPRIAHNFIKNGYYPTDEVTLARILTAIDTTSSCVRILDPCCGEGVALAEVKNYLVSECAAESVEALGVEFDEERAWHAKTLLDRVQHADVHDVVVSARSIGLLFLNPPYGAAVADSAGTGDGKRADRLEKMFLRRALGTLQFGGVLVLIVPYTTLDEEMANLLVRNFDHVSAWMAPEQQFKQAVLFGVKRRAARPNDKRLAELVAIGRGELPPELPELWCGEPYLVPAATDEATFGFAAIRLNGKELATEVARFLPATLWPQFHAVLGQVREVDRPPLKQLSQWHLALALAAGQIGGFVDGRDGQTLLIKGDTFKDKVVSVETEERDDGSIAETRVLTDRFVPMIRAIDFTEQTPGFGDVITIC